MKSKFKLTLTILLSFILIINTSLYASTLPSNSQQDVQQYISNLILLKNNMYTLAQEIVFSWDDTSSADDALTRLHSSLNNTANKIGLNLNSAPQDSSLYRNLLILFNATNYLKAALYELELLAQQNTPSEKIRTLERYFNFLIYANNSIRFFDNLQSIS